MDSAKRDCRIWISIETSSAARVASASKTLHAANSLEDLIQRGRRRAREKANSPDRLERPAGAIRLEGGVSVGPVCYLTENFTECGTGSPVTTKFRRYVPDAYPLVLRLKMYIPGVPAV